MNWRCAASSVLLALALPVHAAEPRRVSFRTVDGWTIAALYRAPRKGKPVAVLVHGAAAGKTEWDRLVEALGRRGWGTLALDLRGHGESAGKGDFRAFDASGEWPRASADVEAALGFLREKGIASGRIGVVGASIGANLVSRVKAAWYALLSPGEDYRGVALAEDFAGRPVLAAASPPDAYAFRTLAGLGARGAFVLQARGGHGAQMLEEKEFLRKLLDWLGRR